MSRLSTAIALVALSSLPILAACGEESSTTSNMDQCTPCQCLDAGSDHEATGGSGGSGGSGGTGASNTGGTGGSGGSGATGGSQAWPDASTPDASVECTVVEEVPIGAIIAFASEEVPGETWLECDGAEVSTTDYPDLYAVVGDTFGTADTGKFKLPDLRGTFLRGWDHGRGFDPEAENRTGGDHVGSDQADDIKQHTHPTGTNSGKAQGGESVVDPGGAWQTYPNNHVFTLDFSGLPDSIGPNTPTAPETRPRNTAVMFIIKAKPATTETPGVQ